MTGTSIYKSSRSQQSDLGPRKGRPERKLFVNGDGEERVDLFNRGKTSPCVSQKVNRKRKGAEESGTSSSPEEKL